MSEGAPDLVSLVLSAQPAVACTASVDLGKAAQAALLDLIRLGNPALAARLHAGAGLKPYTASGLHGAGPGLRGQAALAPGRGYWLRFTSCDPELSALLLGWAARPPDLLRLGPAVLRVVGATAGASDHPWAGHDTWLGLVERGMAAPAPAAWRFEFLSPTAFASGGRSWLWPEPGILFDSLARKWDAFSPLPLQACMRQPADQVWAASRYDLRTRTVEYGAEHRLGFVGCCEYQAVGADPAHLPPFAVLARFALYAGVGHRTTVGMGQARAEPAPGK